MSTENGHTNIEILMCASMLPSCCVAAACTLLSSCWPLLFCCRALAVALLMSDRIGSELHRSESPIGQELQSISRVMWIIMIMLTMIS